MKSLWLTRFVNLSTYGEERYRSFTLYCFGYQLTISFVGKPK